MLTRHQASLDDRKKFTALVKDLFPDQAKNVNLLLMAYNMGIAQDIQTASHINNTFAFRYVKQAYGRFWHEPCQCRLDCIGMVFLLWRKSSWKSL